MKSGELLKLMNERNIFKTEKTHTYKVKDKRELCTYEIIHGEKNIVLVTDKLYNGYDSNVKYCLI